MPDAPRIHLPLLLFSLSVRPACQTATPDADAEETSGESPVGSEDLVLHNRCAQEKNLGGFEVSVRAEYSAVQGAVSDKVLPAAIATKQLEVQGCVLWKKQNLFCDPPCQSAETCDFDGTCVPAPVGQDVGNVRVDGLDKQISMDPREPGKNYFDTDVPHPLFDRSNDAVRLSTVDGYLNEIELHGAGSDVIVPAAEQWVITAGEDLTVRWDAPVSDTRTAVVLTLSIDQHGSAPSRLECDFQDTGKGIVPAAVVDALIDAGVTGFPSGGLTRETVDSIAVDQGCVEFSVKSSLPVELHVAGYIPCSGPGTCPDGMTCNLTSYLCE